MGDKDVFSASRLREPPRGAAEHALPRGPGPVPPAVLQPQHRAAELRLQAVPQQSEGDPEVRHLPVPQA